MPSNSKRGMRGLSDETIEELTQTVNSLVEQVRILRQAVDEIGDELGWAIRNRFRDQLPSPPFVLNSFPLDPLADDFAERVNAVSRHDISEDPADYPLGNSVTNAKQIELW